MAAHNSAGDRRRRHDHYLNGTVYCDACGSRLMISNARSARGPIYPYFVCAGRHAKRTQLTVEQARIQDQRRASLQAHYAGALPLDLLKEEQDRLAHQLDLVTARLEALDTTYEEARTHLQECLGLAGDCHSVSACGSDITRRMANQAFLTRIYLDADDQITTEPTPSCRLLLDPAVREQALSWASLHQNGKKRPTRTLASQDEGSSKTHQVGRAGIEPATLGLKVPCSTS